MQQNQAPLPNNLPSYTGFLYPIDQEDKKNHVTPHATLYQGDIMDSLNSFFSRDFNWEYFSNELEFE